MIPKYETRRSPMKKEETPVLMAEGYQQMAEENLRLAQEAYPVVAETLLRNTRWHEREVHQGMNVIAAPAHRREKDLIPVSGVKHGQPRGC